MTQSQPTERRTRNYRPEFWGPTFPPFPALVPQCGWAGVYGRLELLPKEQNKPLGASLPKLLEIFICHIETVSNTDSSVSRNASLPSSSLSPLLPLQDPECIAPFPSLPPSRALWTVSFHLLSGMPSACEGAHGHQMEGKPRANPPPCASQEDKTEIKAS